LSSCTDLIVEIGIRREEKATFTIMEFVAEVIAEIVKTLIPTMTMMKIS
jgi:hypothetical protein